MLPLRRWLPRRLRPLLLCFTGASLLLVGLTGWVAMRSSYQRWDHAARSWARTAEMLVEKRDIPTLDAVSQYLRQTYPSASFEIRQLQGERSIQWQYPENRVHREGERSWLGRTFTLRTGAQYKAYVDGAPWEVLSTGVRAWAGGWVLVLLTLAGIWALFLVSVRRIVNEVDRLGRGEGTGVLEFSEMTLRLAAAERAQAQARVDAAKAALATQVGHDIQSPLAALRVLARDSAGWPEGHREVLDAVVSRVQAISSTLLEAGKVTRGEDGFEDATQVVPLLGALLDEKRVQYRDRKAIRLELAASSPNVSVGISGVALARVISNLIDNAVEALASSGTCSVSVDEMQAQGRVRIRVQDDGPGIPAAIRDRIGSPGLTLGKPKGSGLGLFHAIESARSWGGAFKIESTEGRGTCAILDIPRPAPDRADGESSFRSH